MEDAQSLGMCSLPADLLEAIWLSAITSPSELIAACGVNQELRALLATPSDIRTGRGLWRRVFDHLDPCAVLLLADDLDSCDGYFEHAMRLSEGSSRPGFLLLAHALVNNACVECGDVTRFVAWTADVGLARCCYGCKLGEEGEPEATCVLINKHLFRSEPSVKIVVGKGDKAAARACTAFNKAVDECVDGDTIAVTGSLKFSMDEHGGLGFGHTGAALRILGVAGPTPSHTEQHGRRHQPASIYLDTNCIEVHAAGVMLENLNLGSGSFTSEFDAYMDPEYVEPPHHAGICTFRSSSGVSPSFILKDCKVTGMAGSAVVLAEGSHLACLRTTCASESHGITVVGDDVVLRLSGYRYNRYEDHGGLSLFVHGGPPSAKAMEALCAKAHGNEIDGVGWEGSEGWHIGYDDDDDFYRGHCKLVNINPRAEGVEAPGATVLLV